MRLYEEMMESCAMMDRQTVPDGVGGFTYHWAQGATFKAAITNKSTMTTQIAEKPDATEAYLVTVEKGISLDFHDVFKRLQDNATFRVTGYARDSETPARASFQFGQVTAERWELTGEVAQND